MMLVEVRKEEIHSYGCRETCEDNHDELQGHTGPKPIGQEEWQHIDEFQNVDAHSSPYVGESQSDEYMVQVGLIGNERRTAMIDAQQHNSNGIENGDAQSCQAKGDDSEIGVGPADAWGVVDGTHAEDA